jgi:hypothetical protein
VDTPIAAKLLREQPLESGFHPVPPEVGTRTRLLEASLAKAAQRSLEAGLAGKTTHTDAVFLEVIAAPRPPARRLVGLDAHLLKFLASVLPDSVMDWVLSTAAEVARQ